MTSPQPPSAQALTGLEGFLTLANDPTQINVVPATNITVLKDTDGGPLDATEVLVRYLESLPNRTADPVLNRMRLVRPLPAAGFGFPEMQPLRGVPQ